MDASAAGRARGSANGRPEGHPGHGAGALAGSAGGPGRLGRLGRQQLHHQGRHDLDLPVGRPGRSAGPADPAGAARARLPGSSEQVQGRGQVQKAEGFRQGSGGGAVHPEDRSGSSGLRQGGVRVGVRARVGVASEWVSGPRRGSRFRPGVRRHGGVGMDQAGNGWVGGGGGGGAATTGLGAGVSASWADGPSPSAGS